MLTVKDIKKILDENKIKYYSFWDKKYLIEVLKEHRLMPETIPKSETYLKRIRKEEKVVNPKYDRLKTIQKNPRRVVLEDVQTGEKLEFPSIYKAGKFINHCPQTILNWDGRVWKDKYKINVFKKIA